jgi:predicted Zn-dependent peptidase
MAGGFDPEEAAGLFAARLDLPPSDPVQGRVCPDPVGPGFVNYIRDVSQEYLCLATLVPHFGDERRYALQVLSTVLGGGMSSRLFQSIREEAGLAYAVYTYTDLCHDTGILCSSLGVSARNAAAALERTLEEMNRLRTDGFSEAELDAAKAQIRGGILMGLESLSSRMNRLARSQIYSVEFQTVDELIGAYEKLSVRDVMEQAAEFLDPARYSLVAYGPTETPTLDVLSWKDVEEK